MKLCTACMSTALLVLSPSAGCQSSLRDADPSVDEPASEQADAIQRFNESKAYQGTIGSYSWFEGMRDLPVRGYGLVVGLGEHGSRRCPARIRKRLSAEIRKKYGLGDARKGLDHISIEKMINAPDTAVVFVRGSIRPAALGGTKFDLTIQALPDTETTSLAGGRLYTCDLRYYQQRGAGVVQEGKVVARGEGPVFVNPFAQRESSATPVDLRTARIIGGGTNLKARRVRVVLSSPSYAMAVNVQDKINDRFGGGAKIAVAESPSYISLKIPSEYQDRELYFLALVRHLYLSREPGFENRRALDLAAEMPDLRAPHDSIGLALEGLGKSIRPAVRSLYTHALPHVTFYAARTGLRMSDDLAVAVLGEHALDPNSPYQEEAIRTLGEAASRFRTTHPLWQVLNSNLDINARVSAYEGLVGHQDTFVSSKNIGNNFIMDHIPAHDGGDLIYCKVAAEPRIAIIGAPRCKTPLFYRHDQGLVTLIADAQAQEITVIRQTASGRVSPPTTTSLEVTDLISLLGAKAGTDKFGKVNGLGLDYAQIIDVIADLCENGTIDAVFKIERPGTVEATGPKRQTGRPGSEL
ncbi:MAG: flagellar basal body P-ring protein FlgI [Planctomycetota bacterium]|nr:flagellar basal body P-ring protein FlgI [Planctomycetota bacterium]